LKQRLKSTLQSTAAEQTSSAVFAFESPGRDRRSKIIGQGSQDKDRWTRILTGNPRPNKPSHLCLGLHPGSNATSSTGKICPWNQGTPMLRWCTMSLNPVEWFPRSPLGSSLFHASLSSSGPGLRLFPAATQVRIPLGTPTIIASVRSAAG